MALQRKTANSQNTFFSDYESFKMPQIHGLRDEVVWWSMSRIEMSHNLVSWEWNGVT